MRHGWDKMLYLKCFAKLAQEYEIAVHGYCVMDNHVHFWTVPKTAAEPGEVLSAAPYGMGAILQPAHQPHENTFEGRFYSEPVDEARYWAGLQYIELNPKRTAIIWQLFRRSFPP